MRDPIYCDYQATTPVDPKVLEAMLPYLRDRFGNASSISHRFGMEANAAVKSAREWVARLIGASAGEIVFTSGSTEGINLALKGLFAAERRASGPRNHFVTAPTEHPAVLDALEYLRGDGAEVTVLPVDSRGSIGLAQLRAAITDRTLAVALMAANNEIGTRHPLAEIGAICAEEGTLFFCDATQGVGKFDLDVERDGIDLLSFSGHKLYAPKGVGALFVKKRMPRLELAPLFHGGGHEHGYRSGTLNVPGIVALGKACEIAFAEVDDEAQRLAAMRDRLRLTIQRELEDVVVNGHETFRLPGNLSLAFRYCEADSLLADLDGIALSAGSACHSGNAQVSHVLRGIGLEPELAHGTIRFGLGRFTTDQDVAEIASRVIASVKRLREMSPLYELARAKRAREGGAPRQAP